MLSLRVNSVLIISYLWAGGVYAALSPYGSTSTIFKAILDAKEVQEHLGSASTILAIGEIEGTENLYYLNTIYQGNFCHLDLRLEAKKMKDVGPVSYTVHIEDSSCHS
jgi:hypothetical protein